MNLRIATLSLLSSTRAPRETHLRTYKPPWTPTHVLRLRAILLPSSGSTHMTRNEGPLYATQLCHRDHSSDPCNCHNCNPCNRGVQHNSPSKSRQLRPWGLTRYDLPMVPWLGDRVVEDLQCHRLNVSITKDGMVSDVLKHRY